MSALKSTAIGMSWTAAAAAAGMAALVAVEGRREWLVLAATTVSHTAALLWMIAAEHCRTESR